jgi:ubiquinone/menaquinone biosynthesis C-methylase UbiE
MSIQRDDIPPSWNEVGKHGIFPEARHDDVARFNFLANLNKHLALTLGPGNKLAYERRVLPAFHAREGHPPKTRHDVRKALAADPFHQMWSGLKRNSMEMRQQAGRSMVFRQLPEMIKNAKELNGEKSTLTLDPAIEQPRYQRAVDIHCMPGSYHTEYAENDIQAGANYDCGIFATTGGGLGCYSDGGGQALVQWVAKNKPGWSPKRILDIGCTVGHNATPLAAGFPGANVIAIDTAAPVLRYGHARAQSLGITNIHFRQMNGEDLSAFPNGHFDWVQTTMFLHETSGKALPQILKEIYRVLAPGGLMLHLEQPQYKPEMPLFEQAMRDWDAFNNNEPFWSSMHEFDMHKALHDAGFSSEELFEARIHAVVDHSIFPTSETDAQEDYGRAAVWEAFGAWKKI